LNTQIENLPNGLKVEQWFTEEKDLPSSSTDDIFLVRVVDTKSKEIIHTVAMFLYWPVREPIDYDEWRFICGARCFARFSSENQYNVVAWAKTKLV
jgi:hypothetical protein